MAGLLLALAAGCRRDGVEVYRVAKEPAQPEVAAALPPGHPDTSGAASAGASPPLQWKAPAGWEEVTPGEMRVASFKVAGKEGKQADVSIVPLPGLAGGDLNNVNRWRDQVGQPHVTEADLPKLAQPVQVAGESAQLYEQAGTNTSSGDPTRILAAVLRHEGVAWFFKMTGDDNVVAEQKPVFVEFLKSLKFAAPAAPAGLPPSHPPIDAAALSAAQGVGAAPAAEGKPDWKVPAGWKEVPGGQFLVAKFQISGADNAQAAVNVSMSAGEGGGLAGNVNRWRGQIGLGPLSDSEITQLAKPIDIADGKAMLVDMTGTDARTGQKTRLLGVMVSRPQQAWFYKLMGNEQLVDREKDAFTKFVQTVKY